MKLPKRTTSVWRGLPPWRGGPFWQFHSQVILLDNLLGQVVLSVKISAYIYMTLLKPRLSARGKHFATASPMHTTVGYDAGSETSAVDAAAGNRQGW
jgi:hypothetical protein